MSTGGQSAGSGCGRLPADARPAGGLDRFAQPGCGFCDRVGVAARLLDAVEGAEAQGLDADFGPARGERRAHHHRHRPRVHQPGKESQTVGPGHVDVERQHIGVQFRNGATGGVAARGRADDLDPRVGGQDSPQHHAHRRAVVDDERPHGRGSGGHQRDPSSRV
jgi:hypothetical protein